jgi:hypothetical protein
MTENLGHDRRSVDTDLNLGPPEYEALLTTWRRYSIFISGERSKSIGKASGMGRSVDLEVATKRTS